MKPVPILGKRECHSLLSCRALTNPISHSTNWGLSRPQGSRFSITSPKGREFLCCVASEDRPDRQSLAHGVGSQKLKSSVRFAPLERSPLHGLGVGPSNNPFLAMPWSVGVSSIRSLLRLEPPPLLASVGVGNNENSPSSMRGTERGCRYAIPFSIKPERRQAS